MFGRFQIPSNNIFLRTKHCFGFVNLRPIVPGHVLVSPHRVVGRLQDLEKDEYVDLWLAVRTTQEMLTKFYGPSAFNVAVQDGKAAGQSVSHVHVHILPRLNGDFDRNDDIYDALEEWAPRPGVDAKPKLQVPEDDDRTDRTPEQMEEEAIAYKKLISIL